MDTVAGITFGTILIRHDQRMKWLQWRVGIDANVPRTLLIRGPRRRDTIAPYDDGSVWSAVSKLNRSRKFLRCSRMSFRNARSVSLAIIGSIRST